MILGLALLLTSCATSTPNATMPTPDKPSATGTITLQLMKAGMQSAALPDPTNIRIAVTNPTTGFRAVQDAAVGSTQAVNIPVPATAGYVVEAISYKPGQYANRYLMLKYGKKTEITVEPGKISQVSLELQRPNVTVSMPQSVTTGEAFKIQVGNIPEYFEAGRMRANISNQPTSSSTNGPDFYSSEGIVAVNAPTEVGSGRMYVQVFAYVSSSRFCINCGSELFRFDTHDSNLGDTPLSAELKLPGSGIGVTIYY